MGTGLTEVSEIVLGGRDAGTVRRRFLEMTLFLIFASIGLSFFVFERLFPQRPQAILRKGLLADSLYVPIHFTLRFPVSAGNR